VAPWDHHKFVTMRMLYVMFVRLAGLWVPKTCATWADAL
jgi:hypothetical protein